MTGAQWAMLPDGRRLHLQHGPIDLIVEAFGPGEQRARAYRQALHRFSTVLQELVDELPTLRQACCKQTRGFAGSMARRMDDAARVHLPRFITPMAAVAGAVADEVLRAMTSGRTLERAYVNNGGDAALHLSFGARMDTAMATNASLTDRVTIHAEDPSRGIATSGWRGRSWSLGIADSMTVLAATAAEADAAATIIANSVDLPGNPKIQRRRARDLEPDSDLGDRRVTVSVAQLTDSEIATALDAGLVAAEDLIQRNLIHAAALLVSGKSRCSGSNASLLTLSNRESD